MSAYAGLSIAKAQDDTAEPIVATISSPVSSTDEVNTDEVKMVFSFDQTPWQSVIEFFVEQSGLSLQEISQPPPGSFTYKDPTPHSVPEAMDILNQALLREGYTLVRNKQMLVLQLDAELNPRLVESVNPDDLENRGLYEVMRCTFDVEGVQELGIEDQIRNLVSQRNVGSLGSFPAANLIIVQETGIILREIKSIIERAKKEAMHDQLVFKSYRLQNVDPETLLIAVRELMDFEGDSNTARDGLIKISVEPLGKDLRIRAAEDAWEEFTQIAKMVDVPAEKFEGTQFERPIIKTYQPLVGPELVFQVLQTNFEGREGVRMDQDPETGTIVIMGRQADHDLAEQILQEFARQSADYTMIQLQNADAEDVLAKLEKFFRVSLDSVTNDAPILFADTIANQINVRGKPADVELVKQMVADMDSQTLLDMGPRTPDRFIDMTPDEAESILGILPDLFPSTGRPNKIDVIMPKDRERFRSRTIMDRRGLDERELGPSKDEEFDQMMRELDNSGASLDQDDEYQFVSCPVSPGNVQEEEKVGKSSEEVERDRNYVPPPELESVPGATSKSNGLRKDYAFIPRILMCLMIWKP